MTHSHRESDSGTTCFGYVLDSPFSFSCLRPGRGMVIGVRQVNGPVAEPAGKPILEWPPRPTQSTGARLHRSEQRYGLWVDDVGSFHVDPAGSVIGVWSTGRRERLEASLLGIPLALCFLSRGDVPVHAAAVEVNGSAVLLAAPGGFGKTTLATAFLGAGYRLLSEDISCCRPSAVPIVLPGPALLRLRRDVYRGQDVPGAEVIAEDRDRISLAVSPELRGSGDGVRLSAVVFLREAASGIRLTRADRATTIRDLWTLTLRLPTDDDLARSFQAVVSLAGSVPAWNLYRPLEYRVLPRVVDVISSLQLSA